MNSSTNQSESKTNSGLIKRRAVAALLLLTETVLLLLNAPYINDSLKADYYHEWLETAKEPKACIINVWHIAGFKPYVGSLGSYLKACADEYAKTKNGIYFDVKSCNEDEAEQLLRRGITPDIISFQCNTADRFSLYPFENSEAETLRYLPYCASGRLLLYLPELENKTDDELLGECGTAVDFKKGKASACVCDLRTSGDIYRAGLLGKAPAFSARVPKTNAFDASLVQCIGINADIDEYKLAYAMEFISRVTGSEAQSKLAELGLLPLYASVEPNYEEPWIKALYERFVNERDTLLSQ